MRAHRLRLGDLCQRVVHRLEQTFYYPLVRVNRQALRGRVWSEETVQWIEIGLVTPTIAQAASAAASCLAFWRYARARASRARRVASTTLALLCGALCLEAFLFLAYGSVQAGEAAALPQVMTLVLRWLLLAAVGLLSLLVWRSPLRRG